MSEIKRMLQARNWMKSNENFLTTWHAHVGYKLNLFEHFTESKTVQEVAEKYDLDETLLERWIEVGLEVGHLKKKISGKIKSKKKMVKYASANSDESVGILLREMMELHIPTLLEYPNLIESKKRITYLEDKFADVVAETSTLLEKAAVTPILKRIKQNNPASIIDLGCGYGGYLKSIQSNFPDIQLQGVELNKDVARMASSRLGDQVDVYEGDLIDYIEKFSGKVDMVMAHNLLYYFPKEDRENLFKNIAGVLNKKGTVTFITPVMGATHGQTFATAFNSFMTAHENLYPLPTMNELKQDGKAAGFKVTSTKPLIREGSWYLVTLKKVK
ncbi:hypothetical protein CR203_10045 [Salipaludibacillus neizhouensis]|uniref:Methyltransferase domain-containing protein n=1 Tax=Salipaludibacillus neizhouensis TaxID=885475 RepID=A0A3A9K604_9BACI|nr:class I SAM-dependent methyltransferase [Salipaludibacillus neizhouensis]RKL67679.1 hypothetical protein CR203_10045 [Salipaludibacillus neizhouensis]